MKLRVRAAALWILCLAVPAPASEVPVAQAGDRVRLSGRFPVRGPMTGTLAAMEGDALILDLSDGPARIQKSDVKAFEVSLGVTDRRARGLFIGFGIGLAAVTYFYATLGNNDSRPRETAPLIVVGATTTAGYLIGRATRVDRWVPARWDE